MVCWKEDLLHPLARLLRDKTVSMDGSPSFTFPISARTTFRVMECSKRAAKSCAWPKFMKGSETRDGFPSPSKKLLRVSAVVCLLEYFVTRFTVWVGWLHARRAL